MRLDLDLRVAEMPAGADPADLVQQGRRVELDAAIERAKPLLQAAIEHELASHDLTEPESRARALKAVAPRIARVSDDIARAEYARFVASRMGVEPEVVERAVGVRPSRSARTGRVRSRSATDVDTRLERELLRAVLADGGAARVAGVVADDFVVPEVRAAFESICATLATAASGQPVDIPPGEGAETGLLIDLATDVAPAAGVEDALWRVRVRGLDRRIGLLRDRVTSLPPDGEGYSELMGELVRLQKARREREHE